MGTVFFFLALLTLSIQAAAACFVKRTSPANPSLRTSTDVPVAAIVAAVREYERERDNAN